MSRFRTSYMSWPHLFGKVLYPQNVWVIQVPNDVGSRRTCIYNQVVGYYVSLALLPLAQMSYKRLKYFYYYSEGRIRGGGGSWVPPPPLTPPSFGPPPNLITREKNVTRVCARMGRVLELNSYPEYPAPHYKTLNPCQLLS